MHSEKYARTYHYPFSPGTTSDDRINYDYWRDIQGIASLVHTEKLDGENNCINKYGVFARSHAAPTTSPWTSSLREFWQGVKHDLGDLDIFLENIYAVHSLEYENIDQHFYVFAVRENDRWLSWEEVVFYAGMLNMPTVPVIEIEKTPVDKKNFEEKLLKVVSTPGAFNPVDTVSNKACSMEGVVSRNADGFSTESFAKNVFKWVRNNHVKTNEHWTRNWKRAKLNFEKSCGQ